MNNPNSFSGDGIQPATGEATVASGGDPAETAVKQTALWPPGSSPSNTEDAVAELSSGGAPAQTNPAGPMQISPPTGYGQTPGAPTPKDGSTEIVSDLVDPGKGEDDTGLAFFCGVLCGFLPSLTLALFLHYVPVHRNPPGKDLAKESNTHVAHGPKQNPSDFSLLNQIGRAVTNLQDRGYSDFHVTRNEPWLTWEHGGNWAAMYLHDDFEAQASNLLKGKVELPTQYAHPPESDPDSLAPIRPKSKQETKL
jgi:hypothetical protein